MNSKYFPNLGKMAAHNCNALEGGTWMYLIRGHVSIFVGICREQPGTTLIQLCHAFFLGENCWCIWNHGCRRNCQVPIPATGTYMVFRANVDTNVVYKCCKLGVRVVWHVGLSKHDVTFVWKMSFGWVDTDTISSWFETSKLAWVTYWSLRKSIDLEEGYESWEVAR